MTNYDNSVIATAALSGTVTASITETDIVAGGKTIILTLSGDNWVASGATFDAQRQNIINGIDSAQSETNGWDAVVKAGQGVSGVVRTSATVVTITLDAFASYDITVTETITAIIPATAVLGGNAITATPTFDITAAAPSLSFSVGINNFGNLTPGAPVFATSTILVSTNNSSGWNVILYGNDQSPTNTVCDLDSDDTVGLTDQTEWVAPAATSTAGNAVRISSFDSSGDVLAFRLMTASGTVAFRAPTWWGTVDDYGDNVNTLWAGIASSTKYRMIGNSNASTGGATSTNTVLYYLDVSASQQNGAYSCPLTFSASVNP